MLGTDTRRMNRRGSLLVAIVLLLVALRAAPARAADPVIIAAGDIASCSSTGDSATAALLDTLAGTVLTLGDEAYDSGTSTQFAECYGPTWGRRLADTKPAPGNHEYNTAGATGYYGYFGAAAGDPAKGYYSYDLGAWHMVVINSNCRAVGGCGAGSPQELWLRADLAAHPAACTLAYWHHPRFSSGRHGNQAYMEPIWQALYEAGADVVLNGHDHSYERFAPQMPDGGADAAFGVRAFVVGTGGRSHYGFKTIAANSEVRNSSTYGVLTMTLHSTGYDWQFVPVAGQTFTDRGSGRCHAAPPDPPPSLGGTAAEPRVRVDGGDDAGGSGDVDWRVAIVVFAMVGAGGGLLLWRRRTRRG